MTTQFVQSTLLIPSREIPYFSEWCGVWCMEPTALDALVLMVSQLDIQAHLAAYDVAPPKQNNSNRIDSQGVATILIDGAMQKHASSMGSGNSSTVLARRSIRAAVADPSIGSILLNISSPGGTSAGTQELFDDVVKAGLSKPVFAFVDDLCASAAYWVASGAGHISANEAALVGSIGTYAVVQDTSGVADKLGVKMTVVKAGAFKGVGVPGTPITEEHISDIQRMVNSRNDFFLRGVASGRNMTLSEASALADGRVHSAKEALSLRLIDSIASFDQAFEQARVAALPPSNPKKGKTMSTENVSIKEIKSACPGATSDFVLSCMEKGLSVADAAAAWSQELATDNAALVEANAKLVESNTKLTADNSKLSAEVVQLTAKLEEPAKLPSGKIGVPALPEPAATERHSSAISAYWAKVGEVVSSDKVSRSAAMQQVNKQFPELRESMVAEANPSRR